MIVKHNLVAEKITNMGKRIGNKVDKHLEKLASGMRINRAADDASGLAISEKMRGQIRGLEQAVRNCEDGIDLLKTGEGALDTVHDELQRMREMAVQAANGTYTEEDREALQAEFSALRTDIDRIGETTEYNTIPLFKKDEQILGPVQSAERTITNLTSDAASVEKAKAETNSGEFSLIYDEVTYDFNAAQTPTGAETSTAWDASNPSVKETLKQEIVPNVVESILTAYPAFNYLQGSSIGIGLNLYSDLTSSVLAYVSLQTGGNTSSYNLSINMATVDLANPASRVELERTIAHEMIHAFMDESVTKGMVEKADAFPLWFIEGMAQTASGPGNWVAAMGLNSTSSLATIKGSLTQNALSSNTNKANYGTGYLACMYLGYKANNGGAVTAQGVSDGLSKIMAQVIDGKSLNSAFAQLTGYSSVGAFVSGFASEPGAAQFVKDLLIATGGGAGGVVSGDLTATDLVSDNKITNLNLFQLNTDKQWVENNYSGTGVTVKSGGGLSTDGTEPISDYDPAAISPVGGVTATAGDFSVTSNVANGYSYASGVLTITAPGNYTIAMNGSSSTTDKIKIANGVHVTLNGVKIISSDGPALEISDNSSLPSAKAQITLLGDNELKTTVVDKAAIAIAGDAEITINGTGKLHAESEKIAGIDGGAKVTIQSGTVTILGAINDIDSKQIVIEGGSVAVGKDKLAGKQPTLNGTIPVYQHVFNAKSAVNALIADATSVAIGGKSFAVSPDKDGLSLWLEGKSQSIVVTDTKGVQKTYILQWDDNTKSFGIAQNEIFTVNGKTGTEASEPVGGVEAGCSYDPSTGVLTIKAPGKYTISGGNGINALGSPVVGQIVIDMLPGAGEVNLIFDGVDIQQPGNVNKAAVDIKSAGSVNIELKGNNILAGQGKQAGLQVGESASLKINGDGILTVSGGSDGGAGIGGAMNGKGGKMTIEGGTIIAGGGGDGAAIGSGTGGSCGDIVIDGKCDITVVGGSQAAGIGASSNGSCGDITIKGDSKVNANASKFDAAIGTGINGRCGTITIGGNSEVTAKGGIDGAGIGTGLNGVCKDIIIGENCKVTSAGYNNAAGIGGGWNGKCGSIQIGGSSQINTTGGKFGAGIGSGKQGFCGPIEIKENTIVVAKGGEFGAGIGSGERGVHQDITISGGTVHAEGGINGTGIGGGRWATAPAGSKITLSGGSVTAIGGLSADGGNIGSYTDTTHTKPIGIIIESTTIQAGGPGEGKYNTSGAKDTSGEPVFSYPLDLLEIPPGTSIAPETVTKMESKGVTTTKQKKWEGADPTVIGHLAEDGKTATGKSYIWMHGENQTVTVTLSDGTTKTLDLIFYPEAGVFRLQGQAKPPPAVEPNNPSSPDPGPTPLPPRPDPTAPIPRPTPSTPGGSWEREPIFVPDTGGLKLQIGANSNQMMFIPLFWLSMRALGLNFADISTRDHADKTIKVVDDAIKKVSSMRSTYGALHNRLEHAIAGNETTAENLTASESRIRDTDMAKEMMGFQTAQIQMQAAQAMLAQANQLPQQALQLLQTE